MHKFDIVVSPKEEAARIRRQRNEDERKKRIFDPRIRQIGVDLDGLNKQLEEKRQIERAEKVRNEAFDYDRVRNDEISVLLNQRQEEDKRQFLKSINKFRSEQQKPETRREFDLYDPEQLKKDLPPRLADDDPRCSLSGMQKFIGEDLRCKERRSMQQEQLRDWLTQQNYLRIEAETNQRKADDIYKRKMMELDHRACELHEAETACRRAIDLAVQNYNAALVRQQKHNRSVEQKNELEDNVTEMSNTIFGDLLMELPSQRSALGPHRIATTTYRGLTEDERLEIRKIQKEQVKEKMKQQVQEKMENQNWEEYTLRVDQSAIRQEMEIAKQKKRELSRLQDENKRLAEQQKAMTEYLEKEVYKNVPNQSFYDQFNTTTR